MLKKIYYHDTDAGGVVYYANYLKYFEEARTEFLQDRGISIAELAKDDVLFVVRRVEIDYKSPARYGDTFEILTEIVRIRNASFEFSQKAKINDRILVQANTQLACVDRLFNPKAIPQKVIECLEK